MLWPIRGHEHRYPVCICYSTSSPQCFRSVLYQRLNVKRPSQWTLSPSSAEKQHDTTSVITHTVTHTHTHAHTHTGRQKEQGNRCVFFRSLTKSILPSLHTSLSKAHHLSTFKCLFCYPYNIFSYVRLLYHFSHSVSFIPSVSVSCHHNFFYFLFSRISLCSVFEEQCHLHYLLPTPFSSLHPFHLHLIIYVLLSKQNISWSVLSCWFWFLKLFSSARHWRSKCQITN